MAAKLKSDRSREHIENIQLLENFNLYCTTVATGRDHGIQISGRAGVKKKSLELAIESLGGLWQEKLQMYTFNHISQIMFEILIDEFLMFGRSKSCEGFDISDCPAEIALVTASQLGIQSSHKVLEPSAGRGNLAEAAKRYTSTHNILCIEPVEDFHKSIRYNGFPSVPGDFEDVVYRDPSPGRIDEPGDKNIYVEYLFDRVLMFPPMGGGIEVRHTLKAWSLLKPGGKMASILPIGWQFMKSPCHDRLRLLSQASDDCVDSQSEDILRSFSCNGTCVKMQVLFLTKKSGDYEEHED